MQGYFALSCHLSIILHQTHFVDHLCFFYLVFAMPLCASVYLCLEVTCWERADLLALVCLFV